MKNIEVRCSNIVKKNERERRCSAFIAELGQYEIRVVCRKCGTTYSISRDPSGKYKVRGIKKEKPLISSQEKNNGNAKQ